MAKNISTILVTPIATEKAYGLSQKNVYAFSAPLQANKSEIAAAIEAQYDVSVVAIKTLVQSGKAVRFSRGKNRYPGTTHRSDSKKVYATLAEGSRIPIFDQVEAPVDTKANASEEKK